MPNPPGILLIGHGTRDPRGQAEFQATVAAVRNQVAGQAVEAGYLELLPPDIATGTAALAAQGVTEIIAVPLLLFSAGHDKHDIPLALATAAASSHVTIRQAAALEFHPAIVSASAQRFQECVTANSAQVIPLHETMLLLVSRGSSDPNVVTKLRKFAELRQRQTPVAHTAIGFVAVAEPRLADALAAAASSGYRRVVVQPHLLFHGQVLTEIQTQVAAQRQSAPHIDWQITGHLGVSAPLVSAILAQVASAAE